VALQRRKYPFIEGRSQVWIQIRGDLAQRAALIKGKQVDLVWHSILAHEWPERRAAIARWLSDDNFDEGGLARTKM
jgi:hypothetical protein